MRNAVNKIVLDPAQMIALRFRDRALYQVERLMLRGAMYRLLVIAVVIMIVSFLGGTAIYFLEGELSYKEALWWSFLRMTDPGYLGDDEGAFRRTISVVITVCGNVLFFGALIAIMTQWLYQTMRHLEMGLTPISKKNHLIILGWTNRTPDIVRDVMLSSEGVKHFLEHIGIRKLAIAILAEEVSSRLYVELYEQLGPLYKRRDIIMRSGTALRVEHLRRVDFLNAAVIVLPASDYQQQATVAPDTRTIKTILSISRHVRAIENRQPPLLVAEIFDARKVDIARRAYKGPIEIVSADAVICRLIAQSVRRSGVSHVFRELLTQGHGNEIYVRSFEQFTGRKFDDVSSSFERAVPIGIVRTQDGQPCSHLCPAGESMIESGDRIIFIARSLEDCSPAQSEFFSVTPANSHAAVRKAERRVLILGWSHRIPPLLTEFDSYEQEHFEVHILSRLTLEERNQDLRMYDRNLRRVGIEHIEADYMIPSELQRIALASYDNIFMISNDRLESEEESDARTLSGYLLLTEMLQSIEKKPPILIELMDHQNARLLSHFPHEVIVSPEIISHMLVQVALRRELNAVFEVLFGSRGPEIQFASAADFGIAGRDISFAEMQASARAQGRIAIGIRRAADRDDSDGGIHLNPKRNRHWALTPEDDLVVLAAAE